MKYIMSTFAFVLLAYNFYIRLMANDEVDKPFNIYDQIDLNDIGRERSD